MTPDEGSLARHDRRLRAALGAGLVGVDEVGRGCLAGPVVAAAVLLADSAPLPGLDDSKKLSPEERLRQALAIRAAARGVGFAFVGPRAIDAGDIRRASLTAMRRAVGRALVRAAAPVGSVVVLVDGLDPIPGYPGAQRAIVAGDATSHAIAAASVIAKTVRDRFMARLGDEYPAYGFARHKGYGTPEHLAALAAHGPCRWHRFSFQPVAQASLF